MNRWFSVIERAGTRREILLAMWIVLSVFFLPALAAQGDSVRIRAIHNKKKLPTSFSGTKFPLI
jgi:hypothetical protein